MTYEKTLFVKGCTKYAPDANVAAPRGNGEIRTLLLMVATIVNTIVLIVDF